MKHDNVIIGRKGRSALVVLAFAALTAVVAGLAAGAGVGGQQRATDPRAARDQNSPAVFIRPARVFDAEDGKTHEGWVVLVKGERIAAVGPAAEHRGPGRDARTIDLPGMTLLPGLMDIHSHIFLHPYNETLWNDQVLKEPLAYRTIEAVRHCEARSWRASPSSATSAPRARATPTSRSSAPSARA